MAYIESTYTISWGTLACIRTERTKSAVPLLAFHGWLDNAASFIPLMSELPELDWRAFDLAGHGRSDSRPGGNMRHLLSYVQDAWEVMQQMPTTSVDLIGHSLGTGIAAMIAATWPERVRKLILIDGMGPFSIEPQQLVTNYRMSFKSLKDYNNGKIPRPRSFNSLDEATDYLLKRRKWPIQRAAAQLLTERHLQQTPEGLTFRYDPQLKLASALPFSHQQVNHIYAQIQAPTLLLRFSEGPMRLDYIPWQERIDALEKLKLVDFDGGHHLHMEAAELVSRQIAKFIT